MRRLVVSLLAGLGALVACGDDGPSDAERAAAFCERLDRLAGNDPFAVFGDEATSAEVAAAFEALVERAEELLEVAPSEARAAARDYAESARELDGMLRDAGYDGTRVDVRAYRAEEVRHGEAAQRLERYLASEC